MLVPLSTPGRFEVNHEDKTWGWVTKENFTRSLDGKREEVSFWRARCRGKLSVKGIFETPEEAEKFILKYAFKTGYKGDKT